MTQDFEWFAPKRYGYGAGRPITWQGWLLAIGFVVVVAGLGIVFRGRTFQFFAVMVPLVTVFTVICARTTKGGWRWRWGKSDED